MAFCRQCGADMGDAIFCPSCGTRTDVETANTTIAQAGQDPRQRSLAEMERMIQHFGAKRSVYDEYDSVSAQVAELSEKSSTLGVILGGISLAIGLLFQAGWFWCVLGAVIIVASVLIGKNNKNKLTVATARQNELEAELAELYKSYGYCQIGQEYTHPTILDNINRVIQSGRASDLGMAINIIQQDAENAERKAREEEIIAATKDAAKQAKSAKRWAAAEFIFKR